MIQINKRTLAKLFAKYIKSPVSEHMANLIISNTNQELVNALTEIILTDEPVVLFEIGDYFKMKPAPFHKNVKFYEDKLIDLGLIDEEGNVFGKVIKSNDWGDEHDPYHTRIRCELFYGDENPYETNVSIFEIQKIDKNKIPHFNGQYIKRIVNQTSDGISEPGSTDLPF